MAIQFDERLEAVGYDETGWIETIGTGGTIDEDYPTSNVGSPPGWGSKCLRIKGTAAAETYVNNTQIISANKFFWRVELQIIIENLANNEVTEFLIMEADGDTAMSSRLRQDGSGNLVFQFEVFHLAAFGGTVFNDTTILNLNQVYRIEQKWNIDDDTWEIKLDGISIFDGTLVTGLDNPGDTPVDELRRFGLVNGDAAGEYVFDLIGVDDVGYLGPESVRNPGAHGARLGHIF